MAGQHSIDGGFMFTSPGNPITDLILLKFLETKTLRNKRTPQDIYTPLFIFEMMEVGHKFL